MHPGFVVYNHKTLLKLRDAIGDIVGANVDLSHLFWQKIDPVAAIKSLKGTIYHFHSKDAKIDRRNCEVNGVLANKSYGDISNRSWLFRTVGYGYLQQQWNDIIGALESVGYDGVVSIEHEDALTSPEEGLKKAVALLKNVVIYQSAGEMW